MKRILFSHYRPWVDKVTRALAGAYEIEFRDFRDPELKIAAFDCVVPMALADYAPLRARRAACANFLIPDADTVAVAHDKRKWNAFLEARRFHEFACRVYTDDVRYPFVYKKARDRNGENSRIIRSPEEKSAFEREHTDELAGYFKQEFTAGRTEYAFHFLALAGELRFASARAYAFDADHYVRGKFASPVANQEMAPEFVDVFTAIVADLGYNGTGCFNYKVAEGRPKIFELNPRPGTSLHKVIAEYLDAYLAALEEASRVRLAAPAL